MVKSKCKQRVSKNGSKTSASEELQQKFMISTRANSDYKWQKSEALLGALEIPSEPEIHLHEEYEVHHLTDGSDRQRRAFQAALQVWEEWKLKKDFIEAAQGVPTVTCCCGMIQDDDSTKKSIVDCLQNGWLKQINARLLREDKPFFMDVFLWNWHNATGKAETNILMIRFMGRNLKQRRSSKTSISSRSNKSSASNRSTGSYSSRS